MADFAQFRAITETDEPVTLESGTPTTEAGFVIDLLALDRTRTVIVMFKVSGKAGSRLFMTNDITPAGPEHTLIDFVLDSTFTKPRSWHEIVPGNQFSATTSNKFLITLGNNPAVGEKISVSDVVLLYHAKTP
jgi:hypothetical protein